MKKKIWNVRPTVVVLSVVMTAFLIATYFLDKTKIVFIAEAAVWLVAMVFSVWYLLHGQLTVNRLMRQLMRQLNVADKKSLAALPLAIAAVSDRGEVVWFNKIFAQNVEGSDRLL